MYGQNMNRRANHQQQQNSRYPRHGSSSSSTTITQTQSRDHHSQNDPQVVLHSLFHSPSPDFGALVLNHNRHNNNNNNYHNKYLTTNEISNLLSRMQCGIAWMENEMDIFDKFTLNNDEFVCLEKYFTATVFDCMDAAIADCSQSLNAYNNKSNNNTGHHHTQQYRARFVSLKNEYHSIKQRIQRLIYKCKKKFQISKSKQSLLSYNKYDRNNNNKKNHTQRQKNLSLADENSSLRSSQNLLSEALSLVSNVTQEMHRQSSMLDITKNKLSKFVNLVGFSQSIIRVITQRSKGDFIILILGMLVTLFVIFLLWYYFT